MARQRRRWILRNVPEHKTRMAHWRRSRQDDARETDIQIDSQLAMAVEVLERTLASGAWVAADNADKLNGKDPVP